MMLATFFALAATLQAQILPNLKSETVLLTYHDVIETRDAQALWFDCTAAELESQLNFLEAKGAHFITLDQLYGHLTKGAKLPSKPVAITFADNYLGFWERAYPILKRRRVPVAMFVHTGYVGDRSHGRPKMDWEQLRALDREGLVTIASQTVSHPADLGKLSDRAIQREFLASKARLQSELRHTISYLAYPNGKCDARCIRFARLTGYRMAFSEVTQPAERSPSLWAVNRYVHTKYRQAIRLK